MTTVLEQIEERRLELAQGKHRPTRAMQVVAKRGLATVQAQGHTDMDPAALTVGRRIASGQPLSSEHVEHMAAYHAAHDSECPTGTDEVSSEDMLWGGSPGSAWSAARMAALDVNDLAQSPAPSILALDQEGKGVSLEVFVRDGMGEEFTVDADAGLIWAPILRSGMLATRPGPNGEKLHEPLVFVPGYASDPRKEIGLQNLHDAFAANAIQHVTIPTRHENDVLDNTGFIKAMKIVDSKKRPGEKVLVAAHDFRDPDVRRKVELGTIANRSCGILYDYTNTETGETYPQVVEHVALTNKPWVTGMASYGEQEEDFSDREIVPMLLSEAPRSSSLTLADSVTDQAWDGAESRFTDQQWTRSCVLDRGTGTAKERYGEPIREPDGTLNSNAVHSAAGRLGQSKGASLAQKKAAARKLIAAYRKTGDKPPTGLTNLVSASTNMSQAERAELLLADVQWGDELSANDIFTSVTDQLQDFRSDESYYPRFDVLDVTAGAEPKALVRCDYGDPDGADDAWVIPLDVAGTEVRLADFSQWTPVEKKWVTDEDGDDDKRELGAILANNGGEMPVPTTSSYSDDTEQAVLRLSERTHNQHEGGAMTPTTKEQLERLGLSEEQLAVFTRIAQRAESAETQLSEVTKASRTDKVTARVKELQGIGFPPGFCRRYEEIALGDDGQEAATLNLSDDKGSRSGEQAYTATALCESLIACLPVDDSGKLALADRADLLTSPISERPPVDAKDQQKVNEELGEKTGPQTAEEWMAEAEKSAPGITAGLHLSTTPTNS